MKTAEEIVDALMVQSDGFIHITPGTLKLILKKHHSQFPSPQEVTNLTDDDIEQMANDMRYDNPKEAEAFADGMKHLRSKLTGK